MSLSFSCAPFTRFKPAARAAAEPRTAGAFGRGRRFNSRHHYLSRIVFLLLMLLALLFSGCAAVKKPLVGIVPGKGIETLQSAVSLSAVSGEHSTAGRGYLAFRAPAQFQLALVSPFGQTVLEAYSDTDRFTCLLPGRQVAYTGYLQELPEGSVLKSMDLLRWVMAPAPFVLPAPERGDKVVLSGVRYYVDEVGMVERKVNEEGDEVVYQDYQVVEGIPFPGTVVIRSRFGATVRITFDEPQINQPVDSSVFTPDLTGMVVLPLKELKAL